MVFRRLSDSTLFGLGANARRYGDIIVECRHRLLSTDPNLTPNLCACDYDEDSLPLLTILGPSYHYSVFGHGPVV